MVLEKENKAAQQNLQLFGFGKSKFMISARKIEINNYKLGPKFFFFLASKKTKLGHGINMFTDFYTHHINDKKQIPYDNLIKKPLVIYTNWKKERLRV